MDRVSETQLQGSENEYWLVHSNTSKLILSEISIGDQHGTEGWEREEQWFRQETKLVQLHLLHFCILFSFLPIPVFIQIQYHKHYNIIYSISRAVLEQDLKKTKQQLNTYSREYVSHVSKIHIESG